MIGANSGFELVKWVSRKRFGAAPRPGWLAPVASRVHISAPQFWDVDSGNRTDQLRIVEMKYGLEWF
jgi:hypothetical protein